MDIFQMTSLTAQGVPVTSYIEGREYEMIVLPPGTRMYRSMIPTVTPQTWAKHFKDKHDPFPSWYGDRETAEYYAQRKGTGLVMTFETIAETRLLLLSSYKNIANLECHLGEKCNQDKKQKMSSKDFLKAVRIAMGASMTCREQSQLLEDNGYHYPLRCEIPHVPNQLKRCSLCDVDFEMMIGICNFFRNAGCAGYIADELPSGYGAKAPVFHQEIALCFAPHVIRPVIEGSDSVITSVASSVPALMAKKTERFYSALIRKEKAFGNILETNTLAGSIIEKFMTQFNTIMMPASSRGKYLHAIGGGFAWAHWLEHASPAPKLSPTDVKLIQSARTWQYYYFTNQESTYGNLTCDIFDTIQTIQSTLSQLSPFEAYDIVLDTKGVEVTKKTCKTFDNEQYSIGLILRKKDNMKMATRSKVANAPPQNPIEYAPFDGMEILRVDEVYLPKVDLQQFQRAYTLPSHMPTFQMLNPYGLWLLSKTTPNTSTSWLTRYTQDVYVNYLRQQKATAALTDMATFYNTLFKASPAYNSDLFNYLQLLALRIADSGVDDMLDSVFDRWVMKVLRPYINKCIINIDRDLKQATNGAACIMIAGGDAMRRYKHNITVTRDIDTKIYYPRDAPSSMIDTIHKIVQHHVAGLTTFFIRSKHALFPGCDTNSMYYGPVSIQYISSNSKNLQFRLRYNEPNANIPVHLYTIDYTADLFLQQKEGQRAIRRRHMIALLDVVVAPYNEDNVPCDKLVKYFNQLPVASLEFLVDDLRHTYENENLAKFRYLRHKNTKDRERYQKLHAMLQRNSLQSSSVQKSKAPAFLLETKSDINQNYMFFEDPEEINKYLAILKGIKKQNGKQRKKHLIPFDASLIQWKTARRSADASKEDYACVRMPKV
jgi:hypothetical protein